MKMVYRSLYCFSQALRRGEASDPVVHLAANATSLDRVDPNELKQIFGDHDFQLARGAADMQRAVASGRIGRELYPWLIVLVAFCLGAEQVAANRFYRKE